MTNNKDLMILANVGWRVRNFLENIRFEEDMWDTSLCGGCAVGAYTTMKALRKLGYKARLCVGDNPDGFSHCWTEVPLGKEVYVIDTTITQFSEKFPEMYLDKRKNYLSIGCIADFSEVTRSNRYNFTDWGFQENPQNFMNLIEAFLEKLSEQKELLLVA